DISEQSWPAYDEQLLIEDEVEIVIQVNGKLRDRIIVPLNGTEEQLREAALGSAKIQESLRGKTIRKVVAIPNKLVNFVAS
ncbi:MAG: hypothetical protein M3Y80_09915, partial [Verrucomicrobiota bacterium]|nr:hypothetical protein [Verrucomicrobiota bacterium]